jgi:hypothetical protein
LFTVAGFCPKAERRSKMGANHRYEVILGALLHDIGKFFQRASSSESALSDISQRMENTLCPLVNGRYSHRPVLFTNDFCDKYLSYLRAGMDRNTVTNCASYHHRPDSPDQKIIQEADRLSSGMEREVDEDYVGGSTRFRQIRLRSIMAEVKIPGRDMVDKSSQWVHKITELTPGTEDPRFAHDELPDLLGWKIISPSSKQSKGIPGIEGYSRGHGPMVTGENPGRDKN